MTYVKMNRNSLGQFKRDRERFLHVSAPLIDHPQYVAARINGTLPLYTGPRLVAANGTTYKPGRNQAKRERREYGWALAA